MNHVVRYEERSSLLVYLTCRDKVLSTLMHLPSIRTREQKIKLRQQPSGLFVVFYLCKMRRCSATSWSATGRWCAWSWWRAGAAAARRPSSSSGPSATTRSPGSTTRGSVLASSLRAVGALRFKLFENEPYPSLLSVDVACDTEP